MQSCAIKRITKELDNLNKTPPSNYIVSPIDGDLFSWKATMFPPENSAYCGGKFNLDIRFPANYPFKPMSIKFATKIYHPNIHELGLLCYDYDPNTNWSPVRTLKSCLDIIYCLFTQVDLENTFDSTKVELYKTNPEQYKLNIQDYIKKYAM